MSAPPTYIAIPTSEPEEKGPTFVYSQTQPIQLPLTSADLTAEAAAALQHQHQKQQRRRRFLRAFLFLWGALFLLFSFGGSSRVTSGCRRLRDFAAESTSSIVDMAESFSKDRVTASHLHIYRTSGSVSGEYTLKPDAGNSIVVGEAEVGEDLAPKGYSTSAHIWTRSGSVDVGITVVESDSDDDDDEDFGDLKKKKKGTLLTIGSQSGSVKTRLHSRPSSSPVHATLRSTSGSIHLSLPADFAGPFRVHTRSGSFNVQGSFRERLVIETEVDGLRSGWIYAEDDFAKAGKREKEHPESLTISAESGSVTLEDNY